MIGKDRGGGSAVIGDRRVQNAVTRRAGTAGARGKRRRDHRDGGPAGNARDGRVRFFGQPAREADSPPWSVVLSIPGTGGSASLMAFTGPAVFNEAPTPKASAIAKRTSTKRNGCFIDCTPPIAAPGRQIVPHSAVGR